MATHVVAVAECVDDAASSSYGAVDPSYKRLLDGDDIEACTTSMEMLAYPSSEAVLNRAERGHVGASLDTPASAKAAVLVDNTSDVVEPSLGKPEDIASVQ